MPQGYHLQNSIGMVSPGVVQEEDDPENREWVRYRKHANQNQISLAFILSWHFEAVVPRTLLNLSEVRFPDP